MTYSITRLNFFLVHCLRLFLSNKKLTDVISTMLFYYIVTVATFNLYLSYSKIFCIISLSICIDSHVHTDASNSSSAQERILSFPLKVLNMILMILVCYYNECVFTYLF